MASQSMWVMGIAGSNVATRLQRAATATGLAAWDQREVPWLLAGISWLDTWEMCHDRQLEQFGYRIDRHQRGGLELIRILNPQHIPRLPTGTSEYLRRLCTHLGSVATDIAWCPKRSEVICCRQAFMSSWGNGTWVDAIRAADRADSNKR